MWCTITWSWGAQFFRNDGVLHRKSACMGELACKVGKDKLINAQLTLSLTPLPFSHTLLSPCAYLLFSTWAHFPMHISHVCMHISYFPLGRTSPCIYHMCACISPSSTHVTILLFHKRLTFISHYPSSHSHFFPHHALPHV
jgi:hypothetical protein